MGEAALPIFHSVDAFLAWEERQEERFEHVGGTIAMMAGGTENHDLLSMNVARLLGNGLTGTPCRVHGSNLKIRSPAGDIMYPDAFVRCGPIVGDRTVVDDPVLVAEVLAPSTAQRDHTRRRWSYQSIAGLHTILLIASNEPLVEILTREPDGTWRSRLVRGLDVALKVEPLGLELSLAGIYAGADLASGS